MLFSGDVAWDKEWFVFAHGLLGRSLASGSDVVGHETISRLIGAAACYMAEYPAVAHARTSVADLLDAEHVGIAGTVVMVMNAVERAERLPEVERIEGAKFKPPYLVERLPDVMARVLDWLAWKGDGIVVSGRDAVPAEVLRDAPDSVLHGIMQLVDHHVPEPSDPVEERVLRNFVAVASAVAPLATDPDVDVAVMRGTAVKAIFSGRLQFAFAPAHALAFDHGRLLGAVSEYTQRPGSTNTGLFGADLVKFRHRLGIFLQEKNEHSRSRSVRWPGGAGRGFFRRARRRRPPRV